LVQWKELLGDITGGIPDPFLEEMLDNSITLK
jgi:hypothetical protein